MRSIVFLPHAAQAVAVSASLPYDVPEMSTKFTTDPIRILAKRGEPTLEGIKRFFVTVDRRTGNLTNFTVSSMHGETVQKERDAFMSEFRSGSSYVVAYSDFHFCLFFLFPFQAKNSIFIRKTMLICDLRPGC
jgi:ATP-dependent RNA helicase